MRLVGPHLWPRDSLELRVRVVIALGLPGRGQAGQHLRPFLPQDGDRRGQPADPRGRADRGAGRLRGCPSRGCPVRRAAGRGVRQGRPARRPADRAARLRPSVPALARLSPAATDGRAQPGDRARRQVDGVPAPDRAVQHGPGAGRVRPGDGHPALALSVLLCRDHLRHRRRLRGLHHRHHQLAHALSPAR